MNDQRSLIEQLTVLVDIANKNCLYDAVNFIESHLSTLSPQKTTCITDLEQVKNAFEELDSMNYKNLEEKRRDQNRVCIKYRISMAELIEYEKYYVKK